MASPDIILNGRVVSGRTEQFESYDLATAMPGEVLNLSMIDPTDKTKTSFIELIKQDADRGASALDDWTLISKMGEATVRLLLLSRMKGGGTTAEFHRVVLRRGFELGVSEPELDMPNEVRNLGEIAVVYSGFSFTEDTGEGRPDVRSVVA